MKYLAWLALMLIAYVFVAMVVPFEGAMALSIHFLRIAATVASGIICVRMLPPMLRGEFTPLVTCLFAAVQFFLLSLICFSFWNEAGRIFDLDTSVFTNVWSGLFSIFAIIAALSAMFSIDTGGSRPKIVALVIGAIVSVGLVFVAPLFR